jgi:hypothetical protein
MCQCVTSQHGRRDLKIRILLPIEKHQIGWVAGSQSLRR